MILAANLTTPAIGTIFWTTLIFLAFFLILKKYAWKPILSAVKEREEIIKGSLESAEKARKEMLKLKSDNEAILRKAREEREELLKDARETGDRIIAEAKSKASEEAEKLVEKARSGIEREKSKALSEINDQVAYLSVEIASKLLRENLSDNDKQKKLVDKYLREIDLNNLNKN